MIYVRYVKMHILSMMQYRASLVFVAFSRFITSMGAFLGIVFLFERFGNLKGFTFGDVALCFGVTGAAFSLTECFMLGFDSFERLITSGDFDRLLLRPRGSVIQVIGSRFGLDNVGWLIQSLVVLSVGASLVGGWTVLKAVTVILMIFSGFCVFSGLFILGATVCFWTVKGLEFINIFTYGGKEVASYPLRIYEKWFARIFTFIIPFTCFNYLPLLYITDRSDNLLYMFSPLLGIAFLLPCLFVWQLGLRHYASTGS